MISLNKLLDTAKFADADNREYNLVSNNGTTVRDLIKCDDKNLFFMTRGYNPNGNKIWGDWYFVSFKDPSDCSTAKMYLVKDWEMGKSIKNKHDLSKEIPLFEGEMVVDVLKLYALRQALHS